MFSHSNRTMSRRTNDYFQRGRRVAILLAMVGLILAPLLAPAPASASGEPKLLLLPIVVHSSEDPEYLRAGLSDMLTARFARIGALELLPPEDQERGTTNLKDALELGRKAGADFVLYGSFTRFGQGASLEVQCSPTDVSRGREPLREIFVHSGSIGEIIPDLDELAGKVSRFARGEIVAPSGPPAAVGQGFGSPEETQAMLTRIEALEAALEEILAAEPPSTTEER